MNIKLIRKSTSLNYTMLFIGTKIPRKQLHAELNRTLAYRYGWQLLKGSAGPLVLKFINLPETCTVYAKCEYKPKFSSDIFRNLQYFRRYFTF